MSLDGAHDLIFRNACEQGLEGDPRLEPGERRAEAEMDPLPEGDVAKRPRSRSSMSGSGIPPLVAVRGRPEEQHALPARHAHIVDLDLARW